MSIQMVLLPVFVQIGLTFALLLWMAGARRNALVGGGTKPRDIVLERGGCYRLRHRGLAIVNALGGAAAVSFA